MGLASRAREGRGGGDLMLVASLRGERVEASRELERHTSFSCLGCKAPVILKKGEIKIPHFAHRAADGDCSFSEGETVAHMEAKMMFAASLRRRGLKAAPEYVIGDQRADVAAWSPDGDMFVIEVQHSSLSVDILDARVSGYRKKGLPQLWVPFVRKECFSYGKIDYRYTALNLLGELKVTPYRMLEPTKVERYSIRPFERYLAERYNNRMWYYDEELKKMFLGGLNDCWLNHDGGDFGTYYEYKSTRWFSLSLSRMFDIDDLFFQIDSMHIMGIKFGVI